MINMSLFSKKESTQLLKKYALIPIAKQYSLNFDTSLSVFLKSEADYLLESAESGESMGRYSFIGKGIQRKFVLNNNTIEDYLLATDGVLVQMTQKEMNNPLEYIQEEMKRYTTPIDALYRFPPFWGGLIGYLGYETVGYYENIEDLWDKKGLAIPDGILIIPQRLFVIDHLRRILWIITTINDINHYDDACQNIDKDWENITHSIPQDMEAYNQYAASLDIPFDNISPNIVWKSTLTQEEFEAKVEYCKECIHRGDVIQVVFSRQMQASFDKKNELFFYMRLRNINPSPYMYFLRFDDFSIVGSSPEVMTSLTLDGIMKVKPIAGTIRRGASLSEDIALQQELKTDEKERAEHMMLVDLGRNDLHRIAQAGTVKVSNFMNIEGYSHVYHIVSTVEGKIQDGLDGFDLIKATFPAGTLSGAPKIEAMNIIGRIEPKKRNVYGGLVMVMGFNGYLDSCIAIRTAVLKDDTAYIQAGGGLVADSVPSKEWKETEMKAGALVQALHIVNAQISHIKTTDLKNSEIL